MRKGEILALQWKDIDFDNNIIHVYKSIYHDGDKPGIKSTKTKASTRIIPLLNPLKERLLQQSNKDKETYLFSDDGKSPLTNKRYNTLFNNYKKETGIQCTAHQLRHSFATIAFENNVDAKIIQEILGHKQLNTTQIYTHVVDRNIEEAMSKNPLADLKIKAKPRKSSFDED